MAAALYRLGDAAGVVAAFLASVLLVAQLGGGFKRLPATASAPVATTAAQGSSTTASATNQPACAADTLIATLVRDGVQARSAPRTDARVIETFNRKTVLGAPQVFLVKAQVFGDSGSTWYRVLLPVRPNGSSGFIPANALSLSRTSYRLELNRKGFSLRLFKGCDLLRRFRVGIGTGTTPTPVGHFYLISLLKLPNPNTIYGTYAYGLSGYSDILKTWALGGIIGLHGTNDPSSIGHRSSHGCIRMRNGDIGYLVKFLPLGTPIDIQ